MGAKLRRFLHCVAADLLYYSGLLRLRLFFRRRVLGRQEVCVLGLHRVLKTEEANRSNSLEGIVLREATFVKLLEYLSRHFSMLSLSAFLANTSQDAVHSKPLCLITFDDGWADTYTTAYPWLKKFGMPAGVFLTTGLVEDRGIFWFERLAQAWKNLCRQEGIQARLRGLLPANAQGTSVEVFIEFLKHMPAAKRQQILDSLPLAVETHDPHDQLDQMLTWDEVSEMNSNGIDFGSHTVTHPLLSYEDDVTVECELRTSKETLEKQLSEQVRAFAYPNGDCDNRIRLQVEQAGYQSAFGTGPGWHVSGQDTLDIRRILIHEGNVTKRPGQFSPSMFNLTLASWR